MPEEIKPKEELQKIYTSMADRYDSVVSATNYTAYVTVPNWIVDMLEIQNIHVLDLGCGTGLSSKIFLDRGYNVTGIDFAPGMIQKARDLPFSKLLCQDLNESWDVSNDSFDVVVCLSVLEHIANPRALIDQVRMKLKTGGLFGFSIPCKKPTNSAISGRSYAEEDLSELLSFFPAIIVKKEKILGFNAGQGHAVDYWCILLRFFSSI